MTDKHSEQVLQDLYKQHKKTVSMPSSVRDNIVNHAKSKKPSMWRWFNWQSGFAVFAVVTLYGFVKNNPQYHERPSYSVSQTINEQNQNVFYHDVKLINVDQRKRAVEINKNAHYDAFLASLQQLKNRKNLAGTVIADNNKLAIEVCDIGVIHVSEQIMKQLGLRQPISSYDLGQPIMLVVDNRGIITNIVRGGSTQACS